MCIAILNKSGLLPDSHIKNSFTANPDGAGMAWCENGEVKTLKYLGSDEAVFLRHYKAIRKQHPKTPILIHCRIRTHGAINHDNCHPFTTHSGKIAFIHNGMLNIKSTEKESDTSAFARQVIAQLPVNFMDRGAFKYLIEQAAGSYNKLVFLNHKAKTLIINEKGGHWSEDGQTWYSNKSYTDNYDYGIYSGYYGYGSYDVSGKYSKAMRLTDKEQTNAAPVNLLNAGKRDGEVKELQKRLKRYNDYQKGKTGYRELEGNPTAENYCFECYGCSIDELTDKEYSNLISDLGHDRHLCMVD